MPLSEKANKDIAESEYARQQALNKIASTIGIPSIQLVVDFEDLHNSVRDKDCIGRALNQYLESLVKNVEKVAKVNQAYPIQLKKLVGDKHQVVFTLGKPDDGSTYGQFKIEDGSFKFIIPKENFWTNASDSANKLQQIVDDQSGENAPLVQTMLQETEDERNKLLKRVNAALQTEFEIVCDYAGMYNHKDFKDKKYLASYLLQYLKAIATKVEQLVAQSELYIEEFQTHLHERKIVFQFTSDTTVTYFKLTIEKGRLVLSIPPAKFGYNMSDCANELEKTIDKLSQSPTKQSVKYRESVRKAEEICPTLLEKMHELTGHEYELVGIDWQEMWENNVPKIPEYWRDSFPVVLIDGYIRRLVSRVEDFVTDKYKEQIVRDTFVYVDTPAPLLRFNRVFTAHKIRFRFGPNLIYQINDYDVNYGELVAKSGELVLSMKEEVVKTNEDVFASVGNRINTIKKTIAFEEARWKESSGWKDPNCDYCDAVVPASHYCTVCEEHLCRDHEIAHKKGKKTKDHKLIWALERLTPVYAEIKNCDLCDEDEQSTHYCDECEEYLCKFHADLHKKEKKTKTHELKASSGISSTPSTESSELTTTTTIQQSTEQPQEATQQQDERTYVLSSSSNKKKVTAQDLAKIHGRIKFVTAFPDYTIKITDHFPDLKVKQVTSFPNKPGLWQIVDHHPDFKIKIVTAFPDFTVKYVTAFPGVSKK